MTDYVIKSKLASFEVPNISVGEWFNQRLNEIIARGANKIALVSDGCD